MLNAELRPVYLYRCALMSETSALKLGECVHACLPTASRQMTLKNMCVCVCVYVLFRSHAGVVTESTAV